MSTETKLRKWIAQRLLGTTKTIYFKLFHVGLVEENGRQPVNKVHTCKVAELDGTEGALNAEAHRIAHEIWEAHEEHVEPFEGLPQFYQVYGYTRNADGKPARGPMHHWKTQNGDLVAAHLTQSEPPNERGKSSQQMRHNEMLARILVESTGSILGGYKAIVDDQRNLIQHLLTGHLERIKLTEEMMSEKTSRDIVAAEFVAGEERKSEWSRKILDTVVPDIGKAIRLKMISGGKAPPATTSTQVPKDPAPNESATTETTPTESSSSSTTPAASSPPLSAGERAELRALLYKLPDDVLEKVMEQLSDAEKDRLVTITGAA